MRTCPHCGHQEESGRERCSACGRSVLIAAPRFEGRRRSAAIAGAVLAVVVVGGAFALLLMSAASSRDARQERADARSAATERARLVRVQAPHRGAALD
ncbi:MAG: hypothetical protein M3P44_01065, partial [Actinomycetota bacterium]|nr:hypothetical protein [Actinomycetota bacterium]